MLRVVLLRERTRRVVLAGCTPVGLQLAARLERERCSLRIVTRHRARAMLLPASLADGALVGDLLEPAVMTAAGLATADVLLAATAHDDGNAALALAGARLFAIPLVAALVADPGRASAYAALGLATVCSDARTADEFVRRARALLEPTSKTMKPLAILIVGCGRLGSHLANQMSADGHAVVVVDREDEALGRLAADVFSGYRVVGDAAEPAVLRRARIEGADLVVATTDDDNTNLMVALVARRVFAVPHVMARVYDPQREPMYRELGIDTVCPTLVAVDGFCALLKRATGHQGGDA